MPITRIKARYDAIPNVTKGAIFMVLSALGFATMNVFVRLAGASLDPLEISFFRNFFAVIFMVPWMVRSGGDIFKTDAMRWHCARSVVGTLVMAVWFYALIHVPLADAVALNFTLPLFGIAGAALILKEKVGIRRWGATAIGFLGVLVILRPGFAEISPVMALPVLAALFMAASSLITKHMTATENPATMVLYMNLIMTPVSFGIALFVWRWPDATTLVYLACLGLAAVGAHLAMARCYSLAEASAVLPFDYARLPFIALFAWLIFAEVAGIWTWLGAAIIAGSSIYIARREAQLAREKRVKPVVAETPLAR